MITVGCDIGAIFSKVVVLNGDALVASNVMRTTGNIADEVGELLDEALAQVGIRRGQVDIIAATGNGAELVQAATLVEDEVTCVAAAVAYFMPQVVLAVQIGGQSITAITLDPDGEVVSFTRNDKCAAGSGRFLEMMSTKLAQDITGIDRLVARSTRPTEISNQCVVFAESEVISHLNSGEQPADIFGGVCRSLATIVAAQTKRLAGACPFTLTGGVARFGAVVDATREKLGGDYHRFPFDPLLSAAIGAALLEEAE